MNYFISEKQVDKTQARTAGSKARDDVETIFKEKNMAPILVTTMQEKRKKKRGLMQKLKIHREIYKEWKTKIKNLAKGDVLFIQFPCLEHTLYLPYLLKNLKKRGVKTVLLLHDLEILRVSKERRTKLKKKIRLRLEDYGCLKNAGFLIAHNPRMVEYLKNMGISASKIISLGIFDYLIPNFSPREMCDQNKIVIAGNLEKRKAKYLYELPCDVKFELYGVNYTGIQNEFITYHGSYPSDELPNVIEGRFGLVWDGTSTETCEGVYGQYLKINNPHKTSLYLASGIPVFIWKESALANFVVKNSCGVLIGSISEIREVLNSLSQDDYDKLKCGAEEVGEKMRRGYFTRQAINRIQMDDNC